MINVEVVSDNKHWKKKLKKNSTFFNKLVKFFPKKYQFKNKKVSLTLLLSNNKNIKKLNKKFRNKNKITDVLSFPLKIKSKNKLYVGDIAISFEIINKRSKSSFFDLEFDKMWIHGYLHLIGYDHKNLNDYKKMLRKEKTILNYIYKKIDK